ncbi:MAG: class I SAM-dependent methyltransferase [Oscillospiraceae bacterium]|nr:class I SAM-dependent methyltransferase [Oscillospiraceae bacterium]
MNDHWSQYVQTSEELYRSRALRFHDGNKDMWLGAIGVKDDTDILEVGCGGGIFCHRIKQYLPGARVTGLDFDTGHIDYARQKSAALGLDCAFVPGDALALPFPDNSFDLCYSHTVAEHLPVAPFLSEQRRVLRPGGRVAVLSVRTQYSMPEHSADGTTKEEQALWDKLNRAAEGKCPREGVGAFGLTESEYPRALEAAGFREVDVQFFCVTYYAPDNPSVPREMALEQIENDRFCALSGAGKNLRLAPNGLKEKDAQRLLALINARFDARAAQYRRGEKLWDVTAKLILCATGVK